ncbi:MAG: shikimate kinase, partial [Planctomycetota bacterium]
MTVILFGMKHCGKGTLADALGRRWGWLVYDTDALVETLYERLNSERLTFRQIFRRHGPETFAELEVQAVGDLADGLAGGQEPVVIALGGRTILNPPLQPVLRDLGLRVCLQVDPEELLRRIVAGGIPPFLNEEDVAGSFQTLYEQR